MVNWYIFRILFYHHEINAPSGKIHHIANNIVVLCNLTRQARSPFVLKHTTSLYIMCVDVCMSFCILTLAFLCLLRGLPFPIHPLNRIFSFSDPVLFKEINYLPLRIRLFLYATICT